MPFLNSIEISHPEFYYDQNLLQDVLISHWGDRVNDRLIQKLHQNVQVEGRYLVMSPDEYIKNKSFGERNNLFIEHSVNIAKKALKKTFEKISPEQIDSIWTNSVTGMMIPSLEARLMNQFNFRPDVKRVPLFGLGCMAGAAGLNRALEYLRAFPTESALFISVELCSLTLQLEDISVANILSTGLFGDGCAAVLLVGDEHPLASSSPLKFKKSKSFLIPNSEDVMGWDISERGLKVILNKNVPELAEQYFPELLEGFTEEGIVSYFAHPGGPKVLEAIQQGFGVNSEKIQHSWESLREKGNMSSVSILDIIHRHLSTSPQTKGSVAVSAAMGPGFSAELGLFEWQ